MNLLQYKTVQKRYFQMYLLNSPRSPAFGKSVTLRLGKTHSAALTPAEGPVNEVGRGWYVWTSSEDDTDAYGDLGLHATATDCIQTDLADYVVPQQHARGIPVGSTYELTTLMTLNADGQTPATGKTLQVIRQKPGQAFDFIDGVSFEMGEGQYKVRLTNLDLDTAGEVPLVITAPQCDVSHVVLQVV